MRIILLGAPGTGKGTQAKLITDKYNIPKISTGDILRENIYLKNKIGKKIRNQVKKGILISDQIVCTVINDRIKKKDCNNGFLLDGFPRTIQQAYYLSKNKIKIDYVIELLLPYKDILKRILGRRIHIPSGRIYHLKFCPPKNKELDDLTGQPLSIREDDKKESIQKRLEEYNKTSIELYDYYINQKNQKKIKFFQIQASDSSFNIQKK